MELEPCRNFRCPRRLVQRRIAAMFSAGDLFDLSQTEHAEIFSGCKFAWEVLPKIAAYVSARVPQENQVLIGEGTVVEEGAMIKGPAIIGRNCQIRHNAYIRENVIIGDGCMVGNSSEIKNSILFNNAQAPHFNYVGDSVLGYKAHLGAGVKISNFKLLPENIMVEIDGVPFDTGLRKFGALLGDGCEIGCNAVLNPGSIIGRHSVIYPNVSWRGILPDWMMVKSKTVVQVVVRRR